MADATVTAAQQGVYEVTLSANTVYQVAFTNNFADPGNDVQVMVHSGTNPVYAKFDTSPVLTVKDQASTIVMPGQFADVAGNPNANVYTLSLVTAGTAVVSVFRSSK